VEDGAPSHRSVIAKDARVKVGYSLKNRVADISGSSNTLDKLWEAVQQAWDQISIENIQKHTSRMADRISAVEKAKGWHTSF
ncbi:hypothetical protein FPV67DRAFT_1430773, partial [Lyophyllum atratum]